MTRPVLLSVNEHGIPESLKIERRWVVWRLVHQPSRSKPWTKVPFIPSSFDRKADATRPETWGTFGGAMAAFRSNLCDGVGFVLGDGWTGLDADACRDPQTGLVDPTVLHHYRTLNTLTEVSVSGTGLHAIARGVKPGGRCKSPPFELYDHGRYFVMSGHRLLNFPATVEVRDEAIALVYSTLFGNDLGPDVTSAPIVGRAPSSMSDDDLIHTIGVSAGETFHRLWAGHVAPPFSHSEADFALVCLLVTWLGNDHDRIDRLFRQSGLYREKWNRQDYRLRTIAGAVHRRTTVKQSPRVVSLLRGLRGLGGLRGL